MTEEIKLTDAQIAELQQYFIPLAQAKDQGKKLIKKLKRVEAQVNAGSALLWERIEELLPETESGSWTLNAEDWKVVEKEDSNDFPFPPQLRGLLGLD